MKELLSEINQRRPRLTIGKRSPPTCYALTQFVRRQGFGTKTLTTDKYKNEWTNIGGWTTVLGG